MSPRNLDAHVPDGASLQKRRTFEYQLSIDPAEVVAAFEAAPDVAWASGGQPSAFPTVADPPYQAWRDAKGNILLRATVPVGTRGTSPVVCIQVRARTSGGSAIEGEFLRRPPSMALGSAGRILFVGAGIFFFAELRGLLPSLLVIVPIVLVSMLQMNKPKSKSMEQHAAGLWSVIGRIFVPHALTGDDHDSPFRDRAVPNH